MPDTIKLKLNRLTSPLVHATTYQRVARQLLALIAIFSGTCHWMSGIVDGQITGQGQPLPPIEYGLDLTDAKNHYISVEATVPVKGPDCELFMATWTPGSYLIREYSRHIDSFKIETLDGGKVKFEKSRKNRWRVWTEGLDKIIVRYRIYANEMSVRTNWVGREFAVINGAPTYISSPDRIEQPHWVRLKLPASWKRSATSLKSTDRGPHQFIAESFHELVDSPIVAGNINVYPFQAGGVNHQLVNVGENGFWNGTRAATELSKLVRQHHVMWGRVPYDRYLFLNVICQRGGGLEHDNSTLLMTSRWSYRDEKRFADWLSLASHEFFHAWNVRRLRPKSLVKYDYEREVYTPSLWIAEGVTSYYEDVLLARAGLINQSDYLRRLSQNLGRVQRSEGRLVQSLSESSYDTWIKFYRPNENSSNTSISYYSKGAVVAFLLDAKIRKLTQGQRSLDDVMREMFERFGGEIGYTSKDFRNVASEIAGHDLSPWFAEAVDSTQELQYDEALDWFGLSFSDRDSADQGAKATTESQAAVAVDEAGGGTASENRPGAPPDNGANDSAENPSAESADTDRPSEKKRWLGFQVDADGNVSRVVANSPATRAGINNGDEIIGVEGFRLTGDFQSRLEQYEIGDTITLLIARRGRLLELTATIEGRTEPSWKLVVDQQATEDQRNRCQDWIGSR